MNRGIESTAYSTAQEVVTPNVIKSTVVGDSDIRDVLNWGYRDSSRRDVNGGQYLLPSISAFGLCAHKAERLREVLFRACASGKFVF